jgi:hypothetical protein
MEKAAKRLRSKGIDGIEIFGRAVTGSGEGAETEGDVEGWQSRVACQTAAPYRILRLRWGAEHRAALR